MAKVRQPYEDPRVVPWLGGRTVNPRQVVAVTAEQLPGFINAGWKPADAASRAYVAELDAARLAEEQAAEKAAAERAEQLAADAAAAAGDDQDEDDEQDEEV